MKWASALDHQEEKICDGKYLLIKPKSIAVELMVLDFEFHENIANVTILNMPSTNINIPVAFPVSFGQHFLMDIILL